MLAVYEGSQSINKSVITSSLVPHHFFSRSSSARVISLFESLWIELCLPISCLASGKCCSTLQSSYEKTEPELYSEGAAFMALTRSGIIECGKVLPSMGTLTNPYAAHVLDKHSKRAESAFHSSIRSFVHAVQGRSTHHSQNGTTSLRSILHVDLALDMAFSTQLVEMQRHCDGLGK